jgi:hypothetical protein
MEFLKSFTAARQVSTPLVAVRTFDSKSTVDAIRSLFTDDIPPLILWDCINGFQAITPKSKNVLNTLFSVLESTPVASESLIEALRLVSKKNVQEVPVIGDDCIIFLSNTHLHWSDSNVIQAIWNLRNDFKAHGNMLVMLCGQGATLPSELSHDVLVLDEPLPTRETLENVVCDTFKCAKLPEPNADELLKAVDALIGLPYFPAEQSVAMSIDIEHKSLNVEELWSRKRQTINQTNGLSVSNGKESLDAIGGLQTIKAYMQALLTGREQPHCIIFIDEIEKAYAGSSTDTSGVKQELTQNMLTWMEDTKMRGALFIGVPGAGKSQIAKAIAASYGIPFIKFDLAGMQSSLVGSSGANLRAAIATVDAVSDKRVLCIGTCNSIDALPPELRSRFRDGIFFFDLPTDIERASIWTIHRERFSIPVSDTLPSDNGWTGREIEECCSKAYRLKLSLCDAATYVIPVSQSSGTLIDGLRRDCAGKYLSASYPGIYQYAEQVSSVSTVSETSGRKIR